MPHPWYRWQGDDLVLDVQVQPRASRDEIAAPHGDHLRIRITAPPVEGKANNHLRRYVAKECGVAQREVELIAGRSSRYKRLLIRAPAKLPPHIERGG